MDSYTHYNSYTKIIKHITQRWNNTTLFYLMMLQILCAYAFPYFRFRSRNAVVRFHASAAASALYSVPLGFENACDASLYM